MEVRKEVKTYQVDYECDECKRGILKPTGKVLTSKPPKYPSKCTYCGNITNLIQSYPYISTIQ